MALTLAVGGLTRLTESGLSITEWRPVSGVLPPLSSSAWDTAYQRYLRIPEARTLHRGISLGEFKVLFWWEWVHRMAARLVALLLALPYFWFLLKGRLQPPWRGRLLLLPALVAAQGALGWYMVESGLAERSDVSAYRLTAHLALAVFIYVLCVWFALVLGRVKPAGAADSRVWNGFRTGVVLTFLTMLSGGFVAGLDGGKIYNTFPLMGGQVVPPGYRSYASWWRNAFENPAAAQFHHRVLAIGTGIVLLALAWAAGRARHAPELRRAAALLAVAVLAQLSLGVIILLLAVPIGLGVLHQLIALAVLTMALVATHRARLRAAPQPLSSG